MRHARGASDQDRGTNDSREEALWSSTGLENMIASPARAGTGLEQTSTWRALEGVSVRQHAVHALHGVSLDMFPSAVKSWKFQAGR